MTSIKKNGQLQPLLVWQDPAVKGKTRYYLIDGRRRFAALQVLKKDPRIMVSDAKDKAEAFLQSMAANLVREDNTPYEVSRSFDQLVTMYGVCYDDIVQVCGKTAGYVSQHVTAIRVARRDPDLLAAFKEGKVSLYTFRFLSKLDEVKDVRFFAKMARAAVDGATSQDVSTSIEQYLTRKEQKAIEAARRNGEQHLPKPRRGAAAHAKNSAAVEASLTDYDSPATRKRIRRMNTAPLVTQAKHYKDKFLCAKSVGMQRYYQGCIAAMEYALGLSDN